MAHRRLQRSLALQTLYNWALRGEEHPFPLEEEFRYLLEGFLGLELAKEEEEELVKRIRSVMEQREDIDVIIEKASSSWPLEKFSLVDKNILRLATYEMVFEGNEVVPSRVVINEAVEMGKKFGGQKSYSFINGVLGAIYRELGEPGSDYVKKEEVPYEDMELKNKVAAVVYSNDEQGTIRIGLVHDIFGYWTLSKGSVEAGADEQEVLKRRVKEETQWDIEVLDKLGESEYIAYPPESNPVRKHVSYYLARAPYTVPKLPAEAGGLDDVQWFPLEDILDLNLYDDVSQMLTKAIPLILAREGGGEASQEE